MASSPITLWQTDGETMETVTDFTILGSQIIADGDFSHKIKTLAPWKKSYDQPRQHIKKERHYFANKGPSSQSYSFSSSHVWMWELDCKDSWVLKNWCFWTVVLWSLLRVPSTTRKSNQSILKEISPVYSLEGLMLKLQYFGHLMQRTDSLEKTLKLGKVKKAGGGGDDRGWDSWMASLTQWTWVLVSSGSWWRTGKPGMLQSMGSRRVGHDWATELNWTSSRSKLNEEK